MPVLPGKGRTKGDSKQTAEYRKKKNDADADEVVDEDADANTDVATGVHPERDLHPVPDILVHSHPPHLRPAEIELPLAVLCYS